MSNLFTIWCKLARGVICDVNGFQNRFVSVDINVTELEPWNYTSIFFWAEYPNHVQAPVLYTGFKH
jgi:hypothetical protein